MIDSKTTMEEPTTTVSLQKFLFPDNREPLTSVVMFLYMRTRPSPFSTLTLNQTFTSLQL